MKTVNIKINQCGNATISADGMVGTECKDKTKQFEEIVMGANAEITVTDKPELFEDGNGQLQEQGW